MTHVFGIRVSECDIGRVLWYLGHVATGAGGACRAAHMVIIVRHGYCWTCYAVHCDYRASRTLRRRRSFRSVQRSTLIVVSVSMRVPDVGTSNFKFNCNFLFNNPGRPAQSRHAPLLASPCEHVLAERCCQPTCRTYEATHVVDPEICALHSSPDLAAVSTRPVIWHDLPRSALQNRWYRSLAGLPAIVTRIANTRSLQPLVFCSSVGRRAWRSSLQKASSTQFPPVCMKPSFIEQTHERCMHPLAHESGRGLS